jgi:hypothetical protein
MRGKKKSIPGKFIDNTKAAVMVLSLLGITVTFISCADLREEFDPSKWRYQPVPDTPSWENDMGRPPEASDGETPFQ